MTHSDSGALQIVSAVGSAFSAAGSVATSSWSMEFLGVPISAVLAAFAGAGFVLSWLPPMPLLRAVGTVFFSAFAAMYGAPLAGQISPSLAGASLLVTLAIAALLQVSMPALIENRTAIAQWVLSKLPGWKGGGV